MLAVLFGLVFMALGLFGIVVWRHEFFLVVRGLAPVMILCGGLLAVVAGFSGFRDSLVSRAAVRKDLPSDKQGS